MINQSNTVCMYAGLIHFKKTYFPLFLFNSTFKFLNLSLLVDAKYQPETTLDKKPRIQNLFV